MGETAGDGGARSFFDAIARRYDREYAPASSDSRARMARVLRVIGESAATRARGGSARVLDLGVGTGRELPALLDAGHYTIGMDLSGEMIALCMRRARPIPIVRGNFWDPLPFEDASFDAVIALHGTLCHPPADDAFAQLGAEIARVLAPGGVLVAEAPSAGWVEAIAHAPALTDGDRSRRTVTRTSHGECRYEDSVANTTITARVPDEAEWRALLGGALETRVESLSAFELMVVAEKK